MTISSRLREARAARSPWSSAVVDWVSADSSAKTTLRERRTGRHLPHFHSNSPPRPWHGRGTSLRVTSRRRQPEAPNIWRGGPRGDYERRARTIQSAPARRSQFGLVRASMTRWPFAALGVRHPRSLSTATWAPDLPARPLSTRRSTAKIKKGGLGRPRRPFRAPSALLTA